MLSIGDGILHGQTSLPHTHRLDATQLLRTECQHATTDLPAPPLHARRQKTTTPDHALPAATSSAARELCLQGLSHPEPDHASWSGLAAQRARPAKQLLENASGAAAPQKGSPASRSAPAPPADKVLLQPGLSCITTRLRRNTPKREGNGPDINGRGHLRAPHGPRRVLPASLGSGSCLPPDFKSTACSLCLGFFFF